ncbi:hypothetical protein C8N38_11112 [Rhodovulum kholense]|uniref:Uncharacterized protein n=1 Tax=Rhodovulum kholense TaxID=453584 RepID=A0A8E3APS5_9RHOB|nr:hypothetical protein C8N38_11112 [Rhodovulum kholense]
MATSARSNSPPAGTATAQSRRSSCRRSPLAKRSQQSPPVEHTTRAAATRVARSGFRARLSRPPASAKSDCPGQLASNFHNLGCPGLGLVAVRTFIYGERDIPDVLGRRARKTLAVCVLPDGLIDVIAPEQVSCERREDRPASTDALDPKVGAGKPTQNFRRLKQQAAHCRQVIIKYQFSFDMTAAFAPGGELSVFARFCTPIAENATAVARCAMLCQVAGRRECHAVADQHRIRHPQAPGPRRAACGPAGRSRSVGAARRHSEAGRPFRRPARAGQKVIFTPIPISRGSTSVAS